MNITFYIAFVLTAWVATWGYYNPADNRQRLFAAAAWLIIGVGAAYVVPEQFTGAGITLMAISYGGWAMLVLYFEHGPGQTIPKTDKQRVIEYDESEVRRVRS